MGWEIGIEWLTLLMFGSLLILLMAGLPLAFVTGGLACVFLFLFGDAQMLNILPSRIFPLMTNYQLSAIPLFIFMASMLERAGIIEELYDMVYKILGGLRGGLAIATIIASTLLAAMCGVIGATEVTMGMIALPAMVRRKYHPTIACGSILAGGTLGILIPPSILAILFAVIAQQSVGELFIGAVIPGLILSGLYILYVAIVTYIKPEAGPALPVEERVNTREKVRLLNKMLAPICLVILVLGIIFGGIATPVEAAGVGTFGAVVVAAMHRRLNLENVRSAAITTLRVTGMVLWIIFGATLFVGINDGDPGCVGYVPGLGGHPVAGSPHFCATHENFHIRWCFWITRCRAGRTGIMVWRGLYGKYANVVYQSAIWICLVLFEKRGATGSHHGTDLPVFHSIFIFTSRWPDNLHYISRSCPVAATTGLWLVNTCRHRC